MALAHDQEYVVSQAVTVPPASEPALAPTTWPEMDPYVGGGGT